MALFAICVVVIFAMTVKHLPTSVLMVIGVGALVFVSDTLIRIVTG